MTDTPLTDAQTLDGQYREWTGGTTTLQSWDYVPDKNGYGEVVRAEFARELERKLNAALRHSWAQLEALKAENARLREAVQQ